MRAILCVCVLCVSTVSPLLACHRVDVAPVPDGATADTPAPSSSRDPGVDTTTHASPMTSATMADAEPPVVTAGEVDGATLRARTHARLAADRTPVVVLQSKDAQPARDLGNRLCQAVVPQRSAATPILLKPNLGGFDWFKDPATHDGDDGLRGRITDPEFVRGVIRCLKARGHEHITIAEGWGATHKDWVHLADASGYARMAREENVPLVAMDDDGVFDVEGEQPGKPLGIRGMEGTHVPTLLVPKLLADTLAHGMFISLPKMKAHRFAVFSMSIKGMQGTVMLSDKSPAFRNKWRMHRELNPWLEAQRKGHEDRAAYVAALETFAERIADVLEVEAPDVVLAEGAPAEGGDGFEKLYPSAERFAVGGTNPILVDRVGAQLLGFWANKDLERELGGHATSPLLETAARRFGVDIAAPAVTGDGAPLLDSPRPAHLVAMASFAIYSGGVSPTAPPPTASVLPAPSPPGDRPVAHATALGTDVIDVDGRADDAAWARATPVEWDTDYAGNPSGIRTRTRFLHSAAGLFVLWQLESAGLNTDLARSPEQPRPKLYEEDCVELFFTPDPRRPRHYFETELGPFGHYFNVAVDLDTHTSDTRWSSGVTVRATQDRAARRATIEAELQSKEFLPPLVSPGARLPIGLFRMEGTGTRKYLAWSPPRTSKPNFHVPEAFGSLVIDP
jgi:uncharacterized protein (DUF362 family)